jgi:hypothetical protein
VLLGERETIYREMAVGARKQSNFYVADLYMKLSLKAGKASVKKEAGELSQPFNFPFFHSLVKLYCLKARYVLPCYAIVERLLIDGRVCDQGRGVDQRSGWD